jgi:transposase
VPAPLDQIDAEVASMTADGAYDGEAVYDAVAERHPEAAVIIPPRATAVPNESTATQRDRHIAEIEEHGRMGWQRRSGYNRRSLVETAMYRYKTVVGRRLHARSLPNQQTEAKIGGNVLNRMTTSGGNLGSTRVSRQKPPSENAWMSTQICGAPQDPQLPMRHPGLSQPRQIRLPIAPNRTENWRRLSRIIDKPAARPS